MRTVRIGAVVAAAIIAAVAAVVVAGRPAVADLRCLDQVGNFVPCGQPTAPTVGPSSTLPPTTLPSPPTTTQPSPAITGPPLVACLTSNTPHNTLTARVLSG